MGDTAAYTGVTGIVYNPDIAGLYARINRFIEEMIASASSGVSLFSSFDQARLLSYTAAITTYQNWILAQPQLDLPKTHDKTYTLKAAPVVPDMENESVKDVLNLLESTRDELINSQSARLPSGLMSFDSTRLAALVAKIESFISSYVAKADPLDLPESSPQAAMTPPGPTGV